MEYIFNLSPTNINICYFHGYKSINFLDEMFQKLSLLIIRAFGWSVKGKWPNLKKTMVIVVPHTSNWDFPKGVLLRASLGVKVNFVGKASLFKFPLGPIMSALGGIPVDRSKSNNFVDAVVDLYNSRDSLNIQIAPEGTRKKVQRLKTGFYHIAKGANVHILMIKFDHANKVFELAEPFLPSSDQEADLKFIDDFYRGTVGKVKELGYLMD